jgi:hypothetical protein
MLVVSAGWRQMRMLLVWSHPDPSARSAVAAMDTIPREVYLARVPTSASLGHPRLRLLAWLQEHSRPGFPPWLACRRTETSERCTTRHFRQHTLLRTLHPTVLTSMFDLLHRRAPCTLDQPPLSLLLHIMRPLIERHTLSNCTRSLRHLPVSISCPRLYLQLLIRM